MFLNQPLYAVALRSRQQSILKLLRIDARRVLAEQWHYEIGGDHMLHDLLVFQQAHPRRQTFFAGSCFGCGIVRRSATHEKVSVFWNTHPRVKGFATGCIAVERAEKSGYDFSDAAISIGIAVPVPQHDVVLSTEVVIAPVLGEYEPVYKQCVARRSIAGRVFSK